MNSNIVCVPLKDYEMIKMQFVYLLNNVMLPFH